MGWDSLTKPLHKVSPAYLEQNKSNAGGLKACGSGVWGINIITLDVLEKTNWVFLLRRLDNSFPRFICILLIYS